MFRNLQASLNAWFEYGGAVSLPRAQFVGDVTIGEGESVPPNTEFTKTWRIGIYYQYIYFLYHVCFRKYRKYTLARGMSIAIH